MAQTSRSIYTSPGTLTGAKPGAAQRGHEPPEPPPREAQQQQQRARGPRAPRQAKRRKSDILMTVICVFGLSIVLGFLISKGFDIR